MPLRAVALLLLAAPLFAGEKPVAGPSAPDGFLGAESADIWAGGA